MVSREHVEIILDILRNMDNGIDVVANLDTDAVLEKINDRYGVLEWDTFTDDYNDYCICPNCGYGEEGEILLQDKTPFCPMCGANLSRGEL